MSISRIALLASGSGTNAQNIMEYADLMDTLQDNGNSDYYDVASSNTYFFEKYITSRRNKAKNAAEAFSSGR